MKKHYNIIFASVSAGLGLLALIFLALPLYKSPIGNSHSFNVYDLTFGYKEKGSVVFEFSVFYFIGFITEIVSILSLIPQFLKIKHGKQLLKLVSLFFFCIPMAIYFASHGEGYNAPQYNVVRELLKVYKYNGWVLVAAGLCSVAAGFLQAASYEIERRIKKNNKNNEVTTEIR